MSSAIQTKTPLPELKGSDAIKAVNNVIVTVEKTGAVGKKQETFITQKGGKM